MMKEEKIKAFKNLLVLILLAIGIAVGYWSIVFVISEIFGFLGFIFFFIVSLGLMLYYIYRDECERLKIP